MRDDQLAFASVDGTILELVRASDPTASSFSEGIFEVVIRVADIEFFRRLARVETTGDARWQLPLDRTCGAQITLELGDS
jgi:hypothetical protein